MSDRTHYEVHWRLHRRPDDTRAKSSIKYHSLESALNEAKRVRNLNHLYMEENGFKPYVSGVGVWRVDTRTTWTQVEEPVEEPVRVSLREALTCQTCARTPGRVRKVGGRVVSDALGWRESESDPCPDCVDGIPKDLVETVGIRLAIELGRALALFDPPKAGPDTERIALALLTVLRDKDPS